MRSHSRACRPAPESREIRDLRHVKDASIRGLGLNEVLRSLRQLPLGLRSPRGSNTPNGYPRILTKVKEKADAIR